MKEKTAYKVTSSDDRKLPHLEPGTKAITARPIIVTTCTNRKRHAPEPTLSASELASGPSDEVASAWRERLFAAKRPWPAGSLYLGRAFSDAARAAKAVDGRLLIVSAGLGLISAESLAPSYDLTVAANATDSILRKTGEPARAWWSQIESILEPTPAMDGESLILAALSRPYLDMVAAAWSHWPTERLNRLRLFSKEAPGATLGAPFEGAWMPYDDRLDRVDCGAYAGTQSDFAQRALKHFVDKIGTAPGDIVNHRTAVLAALEGLEARERPTRKRLDDSEIRALILRDWSLVKGRSGAMLRHLRDTLGVACEQGRFKTLFHAVASAPEGSLL